MRIHDEQLAAALQEMSAWGFRPGRRRGKTRVWRGELTCKSELVKIEVCLSDWDFIEFPAIKVIAGVDPATLTPHMDAAGNLCYFQNGSIVLDRYRPNTAISICLTQAQQLLTRIKSDPEFRKSEIQDEFDIYWLRSGGNNSLLPVLMGNLSPTSKSTNYWQMNIGGVKHALLVDTLDEAKALAGALSAKQLTLTALPCWLFESAALPVVPAAMPNTISDLFAWLKSWDPSLYRDLQKILGNERKYLQFPFASFAVKTPNGWLGFGFDIEPYRALSWKKRPSEYRQHLHGNGGARTILRLFISDVSSEFVHSRNLTFNDLRNQNIILVGCGSVGSYVAQALVRLGAGTGSGELRLIDNQILLAENLGRHLLGYSALQQPKAFALRDELKKQFPFAKIIGESSDVRDVKGLFEANLLIDATGEESVSEMLNDRRIAVGSHVPILHAWILGNGEAVQALWADGGKHACYRCLRLLTNDGSSLLRYPVLKHEPKRKQIGCHAFTPYAVSSPMQAASLVTDMVADWMQSGVPSPRFRTRANENADVQKVKNQDPSPIADCPACSRAL